MPHLSHSTDAPLDPPHPATTTTNSIYKSVWKGANQSLLFPEHVFLQRDYRVALASEIRPHTSFFPLVEQKDTKFMDGNDSGSSFSADNANLSWLQWSFSLLSYNLKHFCLTQREFSVQLCRCEIQLKWWGGHCNRPQILQNSFCSQQIRTPISLHAVRKWSRQFL